MTKYRVVCAGIILLVVTSRVNGSRGSAESVLQSAICARFNIYRYEHDGALPRQWSDILDDELAQYGRERLGHGIDELYVILPSDLKMRRERSRVVTLSAYPCVWDGSVGRHAISLQEGGGLTADWLSENEIARSLAEQQTTIPRPVKLDGTPAPELGYTAENPRPIVAAARIPEQWRNLPPTPLDRMHQTDRQSYRDLMEGARLAYPEPYTMVWSNETITLVWPLGTRHGIQGSIDADASPPSPPPPDTGSRRTCVVGLTTATAVLLAAVAFRHRRR